MPWKKEGIATIFLFFFIIHRYKLLKCPEKKKGLRLVPYIIYPIYYFVKLKCPEKKKGLRRKSPLLLLVGKILLLKCPEKKKGLRLISPNIYRSLLLMSWNALKKRRDCDPSSPLLSEGLARLKCPEKKKGLRLHSKNGRKRDSFNTVEMPWKKEGIATQTQVGSWKRVSPVLLKCPEKKKGLRLDILL